MLFTNVSTLAAWPPSAFKRPTAFPYPEWSVEKTPPLPYRPFRYGPYHITMGIRSMPWDEWIELDNHFPRFHADKKARIAERGAKCSHTHPDAFEGAVELLLELSLYLAERYPSMFTKTDINTIFNKHTNESINVAYLTYTDHSLPSPSPQKEDPIQLSARLIQDDLALLLERPDGQYYLLSGSIVLAGFWRLSDKFGMPLSEIHTSGDVPGFKEKLETGMLRFFRRLQPEKPVIRNNYFIQVDDNLPWSHSIGSEDNPEITGWSTASKTNPIEQHFFRSERQSLRRLPKSGAIVFTIRTYFHPITEIVEEPGVPGRLASAVRSWGDDVSRYKGKEQYEGVLLEFLDRKHREQVEKGLDVDAEGKFPW